MPERNRAKSRRTNDDIQDMRDLKIIELKRNLLGYDGANLELVANSYNVTMPTLLHMLKDACKDTEFKVHQMDGEIIISAPDEKL